MKALMPWYSSSAKLAGIGSEPIAFGAFGWLPKNCSSFVGFGASGGLATMACSRSRKSSPGPCRKELERVGHHVGVGSAGKVVLDGDATRHRGRAVRHIRHPTAIREAHGHRN